MFLSDDLLVCFSTNKINNEVSLSRLFSFLNISSHCPKSILENPFEVLANLSVPQSYILREVSTYPFIYLPLYATSSKDLELITPEQQKKLFDIASGNNDVAKRVLASYKLFVEKRLSVTAISDYFGVSFYTTYRDFFQCFSSIIFKLFSEFFSASFPLSAEIKVIGQDTFFRPPPDEFRFPEHVLFRSRDLVKALLCGIERCTDPLRPAEVHRRELNGIGLLV